MAARKRKVRSFVFADGELREFDDLDDALVAAGGEINADLRSILDVHCTVLIVDSRGLTSDELAASSRTRRPRTAAQSPPPGSRCFRPSRRGTRC